VAPLRLSGNTLAAPLGFLVAGTTWMAVVFAAIVLRHREVDVVVDPVVATVEP
jgi:hypothetical protein